MNLLLKPKKYYKCNVQIILTLSEVRKNIFVIAGGQFEILVLQGMLYNILI